MTDEVTSGQRRLLVLRHAKAASGFPDKERQLVERGEGDARAVGRWLRAAEVPIDLVVCSTARRARQTWDAVVAELAHQPEVRYDERIYRNTLEDLYGAVRETDPGCGSLLLVGHNPSAQQLVANLTLEAEPAEGFPTCALALIELTGPWPEVTEGSARLDNLIIGRDLAEA